MNKDIVQKWFAKADHDYIIAASNLTTKEPVTDMICFHAQQCIEKYLKGFLLFHDVEIEKTHNLSIILKSCIKLNDIFSVLREKNIELLTPFATTYRYPDDFYMPSVQEAKSALEMADEVRSFVTRVIDENR